MQADENCDGLGACRSIPNCGKPVAEPRNEANRCYQSLGHHLVFLLASNGRKPQHLAGDPVSHHLFVLYAVLLSWADLSFVLPASSFGYVLNVTLAHYLLLEPVSMSRWLGTMLISIGVVLVSMTGTQSAELVKEEAVSQSGVPG
jgi:hypothetical protein